MEALAKEDPAALPVVKAAQKLCDQLNESRDASSPPERLNEPVSQLAKILANYMIDPKRDPAVSRKMAGASSLAAEKLLDGQRDRVQNKV